jgi:hypothetical protein
LNLLAMRAAVCLLYSSRTASWHSQVSTTRLLYALAKLGLCCVWLHWL